jgi:putative chitobiose transport system permease protein
MSLAAAEYGRKKWAYRLWNGTRTLLLYLLLCTVAVITLGPFLYLLLTSLHTGKAVFQMPPTIFPLTTKNYQAVFTILPVGKYVWNTVRIVAMGVSLNLFVCALAAYPLAKLQFRGRDLVFYAMVSTMLLPNAAGSIVNFITLKNLHLTNTLLGVVLPSGASVFNIFLLRQAYQTVPRELDEAARIDGANEWWIFSRINLPLIKAALATVVIFDFMAFWNSFIWPVIILRDPALYPLAAGLRYLQGQFSFNFAYIAAGAVVSILPMIILFLVLQKQFIQGVMGALKG